HSIFIQLSASPETISASTLRLYPLSLERSALLTQLAVGERKAIESAGAGLQLEQEHVEEEFWRRHKRIGERLFNGIEEWRRWAHNKKDGKGTVSDMSLDAQSRPHITRKLCNKVGTSP
ncbi:hypothetical protein BV25DRAFT_1768896, partial [Artomyces pyxidatus]